MAIRISDDVMFLKNVLIPMGDRTRLAADVYLPASDAARRGRDRFPAVVDYIPYRKDDFDPLKNTDYNYLARHGYAAVRVDIRGTGASEGVSTDEYTLQEQRDGAAVVEWLAQQPWCDGHVNLMGASYGGFTALQVAAHNPPHLTSIIPCYFTDDRYTDDCHYRGGLLRLYYDVGFYGNSMIVRNVMPATGDGPGGGRAKIWEEHLQGNEPYLLEWLRHQTDGPYWRDGSVRDVADRIRCPVFMIGGWRDGYPNPPLRLFQALEVPRKVLIGPWDHTMPDAAIPGPRIDYLHEVVRWLDYWCQGLDTGIMAEPAVVVYMQQYQPPTPDRMLTAGHWRAEKDWPPAGASEKQLYLAGEHALADAPGSAGLDVYAYHPEVGVMGGLWSGGIRFGLPGDQRLDEALGLVYTTSPLEQELYILGWPKVMLHVASTAAVMGFAVNLCDVAPDGTSHLVSKGMLNGTRRDSLTAPEPLTPGAPIALEIQIDCCAWRFLAGHRIRLAVSSADWPNVWPTPELGMNTVYHGQDHASCLILPLVPAQGSRPAPSFRASPVAPSPHSAALQPPTWRVSCDMLTGHVMATIGTVREQRVDPATLIQRENSVICQLDPRDPAHASAHGRSIHRVRRAGSLIDGFSDVLIQASPTHFHVTIDVEVRVNDTAHFSRHWTESIPRCLL